MVFCGLAALIYYLFPRESDYRTGGSAPVVITPANFESEVILSREPVLAYFWAPW